MWFQRHETLNIHNPVQNMCQYVCANRIDHMTNFAVNSAAYTRVKVSRL